MVKREICEFCDGVIEDTIARVPFHYKRHIIYVDNVPVRLCRKCGEVYFVASVYKQLERIAEGRNRIRSKISFPLADYRKAAALET
jgi:YgiT-type zinc finger domain-containing protein